MDISVILVVALSGTGVHMSPRVLLWWFKKKMPGAVLACMPLRRQQYLYDKLKNTDQSSSACPFVSLHRSFTCDIISHTYVIYFISCVNQLTRNSKQEQSTMQRYANSN